MRTFTYTEDFISLFAGNTSFYVENNIAGVKPNKQGKVVGKAYFKKESPTPFHYGRHLAGEVGLGICPITDESTVTFGCVDIDCYSKALQPIVRAIYENNLPLYPCKSKSGGLHIYFFLRKPVQAKSLIAELQRFAKMFGLSETFGDKHVELFPKQSKLAPGAQGNCITIPYFNADSPISYLYDIKMKAVPASKAVDIMRGGRSTISDLSNALDSLELNDAPCCIQTVITTSALGPDSGRNNFLYTCAIYLKKKYGADFKGHLEEFNERLLAPIPENELESIYISVRDNEGNYKCKDTPCRGYCNSTECAQREFGVGKDKGHFSGLDYGVMTRVMTAEPYYTWQLKKMGDENYTLITFKDENSLMDQRFFAKMCMRYLNTVPYRMVDNEWFKILCTVLAKVEEKAVSQNTDTSVRGELKAAFQDFLTKKQSGMNKPVQIKLHFVYLEDGKYYFTHAGFETYLETQRVKLYGENLRELLLSYGAEEDVLSYKTGDGKDTQVKCWSKVQDETLKEVEDFYADVFESDAELIGIAHEEDETDAEASF